MTVAIVIFVIVALLLDSDGGKVVLGAGVVALGLLLFDLIFDIALLVTLAKVCAGIMIVIVVFMIISAISDC